MVWSKVTALLFKGLLSLCIFIVAVYCMMSSVIATVNTHVVVLPCAAHLVRMHEVYPQLVEKLSAQPVAAKLYQGKVLTLSELESIQNNKQPDKAAKKLVKKLLQDTTGAYYEQFLDSLCETNQQHIFLWLKYEGKAHNWHD